MVPAMILAPSHVNLSIPRHNEPMLGVGFHHPSFYLHINSFLLTYFTAPQPTVPPRTWDCQFVNSSPIPLQPVSHRSSLFLFISFSTSSTLFLCPTIIHLKRNKNSPIVKWVTPPISIPAPINRTCLENNAKLPSGYL